MTKFRKKPVVIEAIQYDGSHTSAHQIYKLYPERVSYLEGRLNIRTLEGTMRANKDDWIIKGVKGEVYPCKPDIFEATYERISDEEES